MNAHPDKHEKRPYVAIGRCGHVVAATVDDDPKELARALSDWAKRGFQIERFTMSEVKARWCSCKKKSNQKRLPM